MNAERSIPDVLQDILRNLQDIVRSEVRLAKVEVRDEARRARSSAIWIAVGALGVVSGWVFLLWTAAYLLATRIPMWAATLVVATVLSLIASATLVVGVRQLKRVQAVPKRAVASVKENLEWIKHPSK